MNEKLWNSYGLRWTKSINIKINIFICFIRFRFFFSGISRWERLRTSKPFWFHGLSHRINICSNISYCDFDLLAFDEAFFQLIVFLFKFNRCYQIPAEQVAMVLTMNEKSTKNQQVVIAWKLEQKKKTKSKYFLKEKKNARFRSSQMGKMLSIHWNIDIHWMKMFWHLWAFYVTWFHTSLQKKNYWIFVSLKAENIHHKDAYSTYTFTVRIKKV